MDLSLPAEPVARSLNQIIEWHARPMAIGVHNSPEHVISTQVTWAENQGIARTWFHPGEPQHNVQVERCNRTVRHEWLDLAIFETIDDWQ